MTKKRILIAGSIVAIAVASLFGFMMFTKNPSEKVVDTFLTTVNNGDYETAYEYLDVPEDILKSEQALKSTLNDLGLNVDEMKSYNTKLIKDKEKKETKVIASITTDDNAKKDVEFNVNGDKIEIPYVSDYEIKVPSGTVIKLNEFIIDKAIATKDEKIKQISYKKEVNSKEQTESVDIPISLDCYKIPSLLNTKYSMSLKNGQGLDLVEEINLNEPYIIDELKATDEVTKVFGEASKLFICTLIDSAINQKEFDEVNKLISPNSKNMDIFKTAYEDLKKVFSGQEVDGIKLTYSNYKLSNITMNDVYVVDNNKVSTLIQYGLEYTEAKTLGSATITDNKQVQKVGIMTFEISEDGTLLLDNSQGIFSLHQ